MYLSRVSTTHTHEGSNYGAEKVTRDRKREREQEGERECKKEVGYVFVHTSRTLNYCSFRQLWLRTD